MTSDAWTKEVTSVHEGEAPVWVARAADAEQMRQRGADLAAVVRAGDVLVLDGPLGAGKTTLVQGLGAALGVRGAVTSPTFVIARVHRGPQVDLVHVDAYRLAGALEFDDLDLDADVAASVTVIEWGAGKAEELAADRLEIEIGGGTAGPPHDEPPSEAAAPTAAWPPGDRKLGLGEVAGVPSREGKPTVDPDASDSASGTRIVRVRGVGERWCQLRL